MTVATQKIADAREIQTALTGNPTPERHWDWRAWFTFDDTEENQINGLGDTEANAVLDLLSRVADEDKDGSMLEAICDMAFSYWAATEDRLRAERDAQPDDER